MGAIASLSQKLQELASLVQPAPAPASVPVVPGMIEEVEPEVKPVESLNYAMLHNNRSLFHKFDIRNRTPGAGTIKVLVDLFVGDHTSPYRGTFPFSGIGDEVVLNAHHGPNAIRIPLVSQLMRTVKEPLRTTLHVEIANSTPKILWSKTFGVTLLPVGQWRDTDDDRQWLPSFVQNRDPAIGKIIERAQPFLELLLDDPKAGFDGYQQSAAELDAQVQAIWAALTQPLKLSYVNPPPSYRQDSQRLRFPSEIVKEGRGTCIDLAMLLASCLESVDIHPVIFLLRGHAFPGYWRFEEMRKEFLKKLVRKGPLSQVTGDWYIDDDSYWPIRDAVSEGQLVPLETVRLTDFGSFQKALDDGLQNLRSPVGFEAMIDIQVAREKEVTPIPLAGEL